MIQTIKKLLRILIYILLGCFISYSIIYTTSYYYNKYIEYINSNNLFLTFGTLSIIAIIIYVIVLFLSWFFNTKEI